VLPSGKTYVPYATTISATGADGYAWSLASGALPAGLELDDTTSADLKIVGTPTEAGQFPIALSVTDGSSTAELEVTLTITQSVLFLSDRDVTGVSELFLSEVGGSTAPTPVRLNASFPNGGGVSSYAWSPDGSKVLYLAKQSSSATPELWVATLTSPGTAKRVSAAGVQVSEIAWLGSNNVAAYVTGVGDAYFVDLSGSSPGTSKLAVAGSALPAGLWPSPNGIGVTIATVVPDDGIYTVNYATWAAGDPKLMTLATESLPGAHVSYSYDGRFGFLVTGTNGGGKWWDLSSPSPTSKTLGFPPSWSPNTQTLLYSLTDSPGGVSLGTFNGGNLGAVELIQNGPCGRAVTSWSPDGKNAVVSCPKDLRGISNVTTAAPNTDFSLLPSGFSSSASNVDSGIQLSAWSPDSKWLAFRADRDVKNQYDLHLTRWATPGTAYKAHANSIGSGVSTSTFAPNSQVIAFVGSISPQANAGLYLTGLPASGAPPLATLVSAPPAAVVQNDITWLPGSRVLAYRATISGKAQLFALPLAADGTPGEVVPISGASGSGVSSYQLVPLQ
jgi:Tol biopolymer transport system component